MDAKEAAWRAEAEARLAEERETAERQLADEKLRHADQVRELGVLHEDDRLKWQRQVDDLMRRVNEVLADKERLEKNVRQEVENQVQVSDFFFYVNLLIFSLNLNYKVPLVSVERFLKKFPIFFLKGPLLTFYKKLFEMFKITNA